MKYLKFTYVDAVTEISVAAEPARNGPKFPPVQGLTFVWARESAWPTDVPEFFGTCPDDAMTQVDGVLAVLDAQDFENMRLDELRARDPVPAAVSRFQARMALRNAGLFDAVDAALTDPSAPIAAVEAWNTAQEFRRQSPTIAAMAQALQLGEEQLDALFRAAGKIEA
jgi:hypothetical protein